MKNANKIIVIIVFIVVILFGVGQFFANPALLAPQANQQGQASSTPPAPATQVISFAPSAPATSTSVEEGSCWTNSIAAPFRPDAWRCAVGNGISDPCFAIAGSTSTLLCGANPARPSATSTFVLKLTQALPAAQVPPGVPPSNWAWLVELKDGTICAPFTGTLPITSDHEAANYGCAPGPLGSEVMIFGDLNNSTTQWTAEIGTLSQSKKGLPTLTSSSTVDVKTVWQ